jgi:hypothetical protein
MRHSMLCALVLLAFSATANAGSDVYSYKDSSGQTHYTDRWRPGAVLVKTGMPSQTRMAGSTSSYRAPDTQRAQEILDEGQATRAMNADLAKKRQEQCKVATEQYEKQITARRLIKKDDKDNDIFLSEAEANAARVRARQERDAACGATGPAR